LPFGDEAAPSLPFSGEWTTMEGRIEQSQDFDPKPIFIGVPPEPARRVVLIVSGQAEPPAVDSKLWPDDVRANVVVVGSRDPKKLEAWKKFCEKRGGQARSVENSSGSLLRELKELAHPAPPLGVK
jgi:hypothetical protein